MPQKKMNEPASNSKHRKVLDVLPDLEDLGQFLRTRNPNQGSKPELSQTAEGSQCQTCSRKDTCETTVQNASKVTEQASPVFRGETQRTKEQETAPSTRGPTQEKPKGHG